MPKIKDHWSFVASLGCCISEGPATLHHCHGGSMIDAFGSNLRGGGQKTSDWLVVPIAAKYHTGDFGIDNGIAVREWEKEFGYQVDMLLDINDQLDYCIFDLSGLPVPERVE